MRSKSKEACRTISLLVFLMGMVALDFVGSFSNVFVSQAGAGTQDGSTCGNAKPASFFNNSANWGAGGAQIGSDTVVHLCGTITTTLAFQGSGTSGHPITLFFEPGAKISQTFCGNGGSGTCLYIGAAAWITVDGGTDCGSSVILSPSTPESNCNGIIEATANATGQNQSSNPGILAQQSDHIEMKNLLIRNIYRRTSLTDNGGGTWGGSDNTLPFALNANPATNFHFHHSTVHDGNWLLEFITCGSAPLNNIEVDHSYFYNDNHGVAGAVCSQTANRFLIHDNHFGTQANWSPPCCTLDYGYHHDGIHWYATTNAGLMTNLLVYNNLFNEDWSHNSTTAFVYTEGQNSPGFTEYLWNNVAVMDNNTNMGNGAFVLVVGANGTAKMWNNTTSGGVLQGGPTAKTQGSHTDYRNNVTVTTGNGFGALFTYDTSQTDLFFDYNIWQNSNVQPFCRLVGSNCNGANYTDFKALLTAGSGQDSHGQLVSNAGLNPDGTPIAGGVTATAIGANLTPLCTGDFVSLCSDTSNGGMRTPTARPAGGPWTPGAYNSGVAPPLPKNGPPAIWF